MKEKEPNVNINTRALMYMEEKYGETFTYVGPWGNSLSGTHKLFVSCASLPGQNILVEIEDYKKDTRVFRDNLLAVKYGDETLRYFERQVAAEFEQSVVFYEPTEIGLSPDLAADAQFEQFLSDPMAFFAVGVEVSSSSFNSKEQAERLAQTLADAGVQFRLTLLVLDDSEYGTIDEDQFYQRRSLEEFLDCVEFTHTNGDLQVKWIEKE